jgi:hypothetical protein
MKKSFLLIAIVALALVSLAQTSARTQKVKVTAHNARYANGDTVGVKDRKLGYRVYIIKGPGYYRDHSKQVVYDCVDLKGKPWYRLAENGIKIIY